jgi:MFS family permease
MDQNTEKALVVAQDAEKIDSSLGQLTPPTIIEWEDGDPEDSMNWEPRKKWKTIASVASMASITALGSTIIAPATPQIMLHFQSTNYDLAVLVVSINILGYAVGPLFLSPLSEIYGRASIYHITNAFFVITAIACALAPSLGSLIGFRFLNGIAASVPAAVGGGTIADIFAPSDRGKATSVYGLGVIVGVGILSRRTFQISFLDSEIADSENFISPSLGLLLAVPWPNTRAGAGSFGYLPF